MSKPISGNVARLIAEGRLAEAGTAVGEEIQARMPREPTRAAYRPKGDRLPGAWLHDPRNLRFDGYWRYMLDCERRIMDEARERIAEERPFWRRHFMETLEFHLERETDPDLVAGLKRELRKVRRALGLLKPTPETVRAQTRERVRRHRAKSP